MDKVDPDKRNNLKRLTDPVRGGLQTSSCSLSHLSSCLPTLASTSASYCLQVRVWAGRTLLENFEIRTSKGEPTHCSQSTV